jgi:uncharacterized protein YjiS (DUF1127 family)
MLPTETLHHRFAAGFPAANDHSRTGLPFPLNATWLPIWGYSPKPAHVRDSLTVEVRSAFHDLQRQGLAGMLGTWRERIHFRKELHRLALVAPHMIDDIGLTLDQALSEADRPFWC